MTLDKELKQLLDQLKTGLLVLDADLCLMYMNLAAEGMLETSERKSHSLFIGEMFIAADAEIANIRKAMQDNIGFTSHQATLKLANGKDLILDYTINLYEGDDRSRVVMEIHPINYSQRINRDEALLSSQATTRELIRGLAHEIKNPLGGIRGAAQLLALELPTAELRDYTNVIIEEADRLRNLVDRLVGTRKLPELKPVNIHEVLERVTSLVKAEISDGSIELIKDYDPSIPALVADAEQLIQAVLNIVRNAVQALRSPDVIHDLGKISLRTRVMRNVTIGSKQQRLAVCVAITDNGPGVPEEILSSIFYPMISGRADGTGLGLSIAQTIINQHGGVIECDSKSGATCFLITLPILDN